MNVGNLLKRITRLESVLVPAPPLSVHILTSAEIAELPQLLELAQRLALERLPTSDLPPTDVKLRLLAARFSDGALLLTACPEHVPDPPLSWLLEKRKSAKPA